MWDERVTGYDFGPGHPMDPVRLTLTRDLVRAVGLDRALTVVAAPPAGESTLTLVHDGDYVAAVRRAGRDPDAVRTSYAAFAAYGLGTTDNPVFPRMHEVSALIAGQSVAAAEAVWRGAAEHAVNFTGGLHHAVRGTYEVAGTPEENHGVLNVLLATAAALEGAGGEELAAVLDVRDAGALADLVGAWTEVTAVGVRRAFTAYGCCTVTDPLGELADLGVLERPDEAPSPT